MEDATFQTLKNWFAHVPELDEFTVDQAIELSEWLASITDIENPTPNDFIAFVHKMCGEQVVSFKRSAMNPTWG